jgi:hypothetical protein
MGLAPVRYGAHPCRRMRGLSTRRKTLREHEQQMLPCLAALHMAGRLSDFDRQFSTRGIMLLKAFAPDYPSYDGTHMRTGVVATLVIALLFSVDAFTTVRAFGGPVPAGLGHLGENMDVHRVDDTCWWWGTRWQYGWRGYGWYACWEWPKPQPTAIAPEATPEEALPAVPVVPAKPCVRKWQDSNGNWHSKRDC